MLAYFFAFRYIMQIYISRKKAICLGSITKSDVTRYGGGLQSRLNKAPFEKLRLADFSIMGQWSCWSFVFARVLGSLPTTQDGLQGVDGICDASLASRDCTLSTGSTRELGTV